MSFTEQDDVMQRRIITFTHDEVEALLGLLDLENLSSTEQSAKDKLKKIYARQILSHEKRQRDLAAERRD